MVLLIKWSTVLITYGIQQIYPQMYTTQVALVFNPIITCCVIFAFKVSLFSDTMIPQQLELLIIYEL